MCDLSRKAVGGFAQIRGMAPQRKNDIDAR